jgi:integrase
MSVPAPLASGVATRNAFRNVATEELRNAMDLAYLTGQRPSDALRMTEDDIVSGFLVVSQGRNEPIS